MSSPHSSHMLTIKRILRYIKGIIDQGSLLHPQHTSFRVFVYSNSYWAGCVNTCRFTTSYLTYYGTNLVSWCSKKQPIVYRSSTKSEYRALSHASCKTSWLTYLFYELGVSTQFLTYLFCDNLSATYMAKNPLFHAQTCHIELDYHFVQERVDLGNQGNHKVQFLPFIDQPANLLTKELLQACHSLLRSKLVHHLMYNLRMRGVRVES